MTKQEKITSTIKRLLQFMRGREEDEPIEDDVAWMLRCLKSEGVVIKKKEKLPSITNNKGEFKTALEYKKDIINADLTAYEEIM